MIYFRAGSQAYRLVTLLSVAGEYPTKSVKILGNERVYKALIHKLTTPITICNSQTGTKLTFVRLFTVTGKGALKSLKLYKDALPILDWIGAKEYYLRAFRDHRFPGNAAHVERNHRVAEVLGMCFQAGYEFRPYRLPELQTEIKMIIPAGPVFYPGKQLKLVGNTEMNKTMFTRIVGALFAAGTCYAVYNTRGAVMKWNGMGEFKALHSLIDICRLNAGITRVDSAILFGGSDSVALGTLLETEKNHRLEFRFDRIYKHIYFVPMNESGVRQLTLFSVQDWKEKIIDLLFESDVRAYGRGMFEYDACIDGVYILSFLDGDIARLIRFRSALEGKPDKYEVLCFPDQVALIHKFIGTLAGIKEIGRPLIELGIGLTRRETIEE